MKLAKDITPTDLSQWIDAGFFYFRLSKDGPAHIGKAMAWPGLRPMVVQDIHTAENYEIADLSAIDLHWPLCGYLNLPYSKVAVHLKRLQRRQWCRTYNSHCVSITFPHQYGIRRRMGEDAFANLRGYSRPNYPAFVTEVFQPTYYSYPEATSLLDTGGWYSIALSPAILLYPAAKRCYDVFYREEYAGTIGEDNQLSPVSDSLTKKVMKTFGGYLSV